MGRHPFIKILLLCTLVAGCLQPVRAQYYDWGNSPVSIRWNQLKSDDVRLIYPRTFEESARQAMWYFDTIRPYINYGFRHGPMRTPVVLHTQNMSGNGMVMWAPKRIELLSAPGSTYSEPWLKQLVFHEYRHNVQYNNLDKSTLKVLGWILGQQAKFLGPAFFGVLFLEGDAVMAETELSAFGRGFQPSFTMHYRAVGDVGSDRYAKDYWFCGSYKTHIPDHYRLGYQMVRWSYNSLPDFSFDTLARYISRNPQFFAPMAIGLRKFYGIRKIEMYKRTFADLNAHWQSLPQVEDSSRKIPSPWTSYVTYQWPMWLDDRTVISFKKDFDHAWRIVRTDAVSGEETSLAHIGLPSSRPVLGGGKLWWTEFRTSTLWGEKVNSRLCWFDLETEKKGVRRESEQIFYPVVVPGGDIACVVYDYSGQYSIINGLDSRKAEITFPFGTEINGLAWDDRTEKLYFIGLDDNGMWLGEVATATAKKDGDNCATECGYRRLTPSRHITISDLVAQDGKLYFGSIVSGKDEAHCYDLTTKTEYRLSTSKFGSFQPSPDAAGERVALTTYDKDGYKLAIQGLAEATRQEQRDLPMNLVNPDWKRWDIPVMDSLVFTETDMEVSEKKYRARRYRKGLNLFAPHSWLPIDFYPREAIDEMELNLNLGATVMSQSLLTDMVSWLGYGWSQAGGSSVRGGFTYSGLGPTLDVDFIWGGGNQTRYTAIPAGTEIKKFFRINSTLSLPMVLGSGYNYRVLTPSVEYYYTNGLMFKILSPTEGQITRGVDRLTFSLTYAQQTRTAQRDFLPRWGFAAKGSYVMNPTNSDFLGLYSVYARGYMPGFAPHHSTMLRANWQQATGLGKINGNAYTFSMKELFPRGAHSGFSVNRWASGSLDYQFPIWYPDGGIPSVLYFKRVRLNVFGDYARWENFSGRWNNLYSYGGDIILDLSVFRMPGSNTVTTKLTFAKPSDRSGIFVGFGLSVPL